MALTGDTYRDEYGTDPIPPQVQYDALANAVAFAGSLIVKNATGFATKGTTALNLIALGRCEKAVDNTGGANGAKKIMVRRGVFPFTNSGGGDAIANTEIGADCFIVDDDVVAKTDGGGTRSRAGKIEFVRDGKVFVRVGVGF